jgi:transposase
MFQLSGATKIYLALGATDMRKSFDTLCGIVRSWHESRGEPSAIDHEETSGGSEQGQDPLDGSLYVFCNRRRDRIKVLFFDGVALWVCASRLERGTYNWPAEDAVAGGERRCTIGQHELAMLLGGVDMALTKRRRWWRRA